MKCQQVVWWVHPYTFLTLMVAPCAILIVLSTADVVSSNQHEYNSPVYITPFYSGLFLGGVVILAYFSWIGSQFRSKGATNGISDTGLDFLFFITILAYCVWFFPLFIGEPELVVGALTGQAGAVYDVRAMDLNVSGVTTATQFGISYVCVFGAERWLRGRSMKPRFIIYLLALFGLAVFRAVVNSERIAVLELLVPLVVFFSRSETARNRAVARVPVFVFPLATMLGAPLFFALFEYNRSWVNYYQFKYNGLLDFTLERMAIYYVSSFNNICGFLTLYDWPSYSGEWTLRWLYRLPVLGEYIQLATPVDQLYAFEVFLEQSADRQFNNPTGIMVAFQDWGVFGGVLFLALYGGVVGLSFRAFCLGRGALQYIYPLLFYSLFEVLRIGYVYDGRCAAAIFGIVVVYVVWGRAGERGSHLAFEHRLRCR